MAKRVVLLVLVSVLAVILGFVTFSPSQAVVVVRKIGYWVMLAEFSLFAFYLCRSLRDDFRATSWSRDSFWLALVLAGSCFLHVREPHEIKIMADEAVLNSTAYNMHFDRDPTMVIRAFDVAGNFVPSVVFLDKRPLFFPFLVSLAHDLTGYRFENVFWVNGVLTFFLLTLVFLISRKLGGFGGGLLGVLLLISIPLVSQNATGAGFELANMVMISASIWLGIRLLERSTDDRLATFLLAGVLLAQTRYESAIFLVPVAATVGYLFLREKAIRLPAVVLWYPLLLILIPLQHNVFKISQGSWQLNDIKGATTPFGLQYFYDNVGHAVSFFLSFDGAQPSSWWVALLGVVGVGLTTLLLYKQHRAIFRDQPAYAAWIIAFGGLLIHTGLMLCYFWGKWDDPIIRRLSLPCHLLFIFSFVGICTQLIPHRRRWVIMASLTGIFIFSFTIPASAKHRYSNENMAARVASWTNEFARKQKGKKLLVLDRNGGAVWLLNQQAAGTPGTLVDRTEAFLYHYKVHTFDDILVVQRLTVDLKTGVVGLSADDDVGPAFKLETVAEKKFGVGYSARIARVVSFDEEKLRAWAADQKKERKLPPSERSQMKVERVSEQEWFELLP
jgi:hypothetical protein